MQGAAVLMRGIETSFGVCAGVGEVRAVEGS